ncbi:hypothetical protein ADL06_28375 [Streptomyces sp. NRRL F-6491]|nr:hypothetical protein ADL06_28375 [Streptomyces sp. NRRL F-6491]KOX37933.1 hypothetical protein ADL08_27975 [Streptomyces sp. NRRL F-6492]
MRGGEPDFVDRAVRRAELDRPEPTDTFEPYFHALERSPGPRPPRRDFTEEEEEVRVACRAGQRERVRREERAARRWGRGP